MARLFDDAQKEFLSRLDDPAVVGDPPLTMACWFHGDDASISSHLMTIASPTIGHAYTLGLRSADDGQRVAASCRGEDGVWYRAETTGPWTTDAWSHACGVWASSSSRQAYLDGANQGTSADVCSPSELMRTNIGGILYGYGTPTGCFSGRIAEAAIWSAALADAEIRALAAGYCPLLIRPGDLAAYWPLGGIFGRNDRDWWKHGYHLTSFNVPQWADHAPVIYPSRPLVVGRESAGSSSAAACAYRAVAGRVWHPGAAAARQDVTGPCAGQVFTPGQLVGNAYA